MYFSYSVEDGGQVYYIDTVHKILDSQEQKRVPRS